LPHKDELLLLTLGWGAAGRGPPCHCGPELVASGWRTGWSL